MITRIITYSLFTLLLIACHKQAEPQIVAGYIVGSTSAEQVTIVGDTIAQSTFLIDEMTLIEGDTLIEGNIAEIIFLPPDEEGSLPRAERITTDKTYTKALGRWATEKSAPLKIDIELLPHGRIKQQAPDQVLRFERWQLSGIEDEVVLYGTLSLPPDWATYTKQRNIDKLTPLPQRRPREFNVVARLDKQGDNNTESRRVMIFQSKGNESKLFFQD